MDGSGRVEMKVGESRWGNKRMNLSWEYIDYVVTLNTCGR